MPHARSLAGSPENAATTEQAEAAQARPGLMGPGGATAGGAGSGERPRSTWLSEDRKIWAAGEEPAPGVLGAGPASGRTDEEEGTERERTVWLDEEREVWTGGETALQGTIGAVPSRPGAAGATQEDEPDILDVAQLQKLLDSLDQDGEAPGDGSKRRRQSVGLFDDVAEMNEFGRLLNG